MRLSQIEVDRLAQAAYSSWKRRQMMHPDNPVRVAEWTELEDYEKDTFRDIAGSVLSAHANRRKQ